MCYEISDGKYFVVMGINKCFHPLASLFALELHDVGEGDGVIIKDKVFKGCVVVCTDESE